MIRCQKSSPTSSRSCRYDLTDPDGMSCRQQALTFGDVVEMTTSGPRGTRTPPSEVTLQSTRRPPVIAGWNAPTHGRYPAKSHAFDTMQAAR
jgi:hypothetical protein